MQYFHLIHLSESFYQFQKNEFRKHFSILVNQRKMSYLVIYFLCAQSFSLSSCLPFCWRYGWFVIIKSINFSVCGWIFSRHSCSEGGVNSLLRCWQCFSILLLHLQFICCFVSTNFTLLSPLTRSLPCFFCYFGNTRRLQLGVLVAFSAQLWMQSWNPYTRR